MNIDKIKLDLVKLIKNKKGVSYVEIEIYFDEIGFDYERTLSICGGNENIIMWDGWNEQACRLIHELINNRLVEIQPTNEIIYYIDGKILTIPVYRGDKPYTQWLPVEFN